MVQLNAEGNDIWTAHPRLIMTSATAEPESGRKIVRVYDGLGAPFTLLLCTLALFDVVNEKPIDEVARRFRISRGTLQTLQQQSATYAAMVVAFCSRLGWTYLCDLLKGFASRLAFGVRRELTELVSIAGIDASRARVFHEHDITSMVELSNCTTKKISDVLSLAVPFNRFALYTFFNRVKVYLDMVCFMTSYNPVM
ncbi:hypothetical protein OSTOST_21087, partial [Ostertagia ostertagi]